MTEGLIDDDRGGFRSGKGCVDQTGEKAQENRRRVYMSFMDLEKAYDRVSRRP